MASTGHALPDTGARTTLPWSGDPLLDAKLTVPAAPRAHVARHRLLDGLSAGAAGPLTLITGPAGTGKTTLAAAWARSGGPPGPVAWLTLDMYDRTPGVFWSYVVEALRRALPRLPDGIGMPSAPGDAGTSLLTRLAAATERLPAPVVLVLDGFEKVAGRRVPAGLEFLLEHAGPLWRLVITSRVDPLLPLHRYRAEDRLTEIRGADLAFTPHEVAVLLRRHDLRPPEDVVQALTRRTEGWAAGLRLCALAMGRTDDPAAFVRSLVSSEQVVSGYLLAEVLDAQSAATTELLLRTSVLDRLHPDLANALGGGGDAEAILARLTRENAFVEPVPGTTWCRVHPLFAEVLRTQLRIRHPGLAPRLHARAARWLAGAGCVTEALEHAAQAGDWQYATWLALRQLLVGSLLATPEAERVAGAFAGMPSSVPGAEPALVAAACRLARQDRAGCRTHLAAAERARDERRPAGPHPRGTDPQPHPEVALTHALLRLLCGPGDGERGEHDGVGAHGPHRGGRGDGDVGGDGDGGDGRRLRAAEEAARAVSDLQRQLPAGLVRVHPEIEALRLHGLARAFLGAGRLGEARHLGAEAVDACTTDATLPLRHRALGLLALAESAEGALTSAEDHALRALALTEGQGVGPDQCSGAGYLALAVVVVERDEREDREAAHRRLEQALACPDVPDDPVLAAEAAVLRARLELSRGRWEAALGALPGPGAAGERWPAQRLALTRAVVALARGDHRAAIAAVHDVPADGPAPLIALAGAHLVAGRPDRARRLLDRACGSPRLSLPDRVAAQLVRAHAAVLADDRTTAQRLLVDALDAARPERLRRPFTDAGPWLRHLLGGIDGTAAAPARGAWLTARGGAALPCPVTPLSGREREVLGCVQRMMTVDEIAAELTLSVNTVKTHLRSVYRKLGVSRRRDAVERARELHVL
ncbi:LuxR C-terminal-related transcriptional regulator [Streptomyces sp. NRRL S-337]|uniref:LuxR C-terminal-related transcriptional regulator n=1 Tax=Streptomyces sp. NRRL S-337 TaxID=1463900 RepID=UPI00068C3866|nr:LuxR C-terminal-related transcriptional regulator [Streptomyces sp. NRRL S-337]